MSTIREITMQVKSDSFKMAALDNDTRNNALQAIIENLQAHIMPTNWNFFTIKQSISIVTSKSIL